MHAILAFGLPGPMEWIIIGLIGLLLFGRRLPDIARSLGKSIVEFKKGVRDVQDELDTSTAAGRDRKLPPSPEPVDPKRLEQPADTANEQAPPGE